MKAMSDSQKSALELLYDRPTRWHGAREDGISGTTLGALEDRGLAETRWKARPYRHLVGRITPDGILEVERRRRLRAARDLRLTHADLDVIEGIVRTAPAGSVTAALETVEKLRGIAVVAATETGTGR